MANDFRIRLAARQEGGAVLVKALLTHPMENGFGKTADGKPVPAEFITDIRLELNGQVVAAMETGSGIAADPLFGWRIRGAGPGDRVRLSWRDNLGRERSQETTVP